VAADRPWWQLTKTPFWGFFFGGWFGLLGLVALLNSGGHAVLRVLSIVGLVQAGCLLASAVAAVPA